MRSQEFKKYQSVILIQDLSYIIPRMKTNLDENMSIRHPNKLFIRELKKNSYGTYGNIVYKKLPLSIYRLPPRIYGYKKYF